MAKGLFGIFYLDANKAYFFGSNSASTLQVDIPADTMSYFDIINREKFYQIIQALVTTNKIEPVPLVVIVTPSATYEMDVQSKVPDEANTQTQQFLDSIPFEKVLSRTYKMQEGTKVFATNKDIYEAIKHGFEKMHFSISAIVSLSVLQQMMPDIGTSVNLEMLASRIDAIKPYSFITLDEINNLIKPNQQHEEENKPNPLRLYGLIGVFVVLIGVLVIMVIFALKPPQQPVVARRVPLRILTPTPIPSIVPVVTSKQSTTSGQIISPVEKPSTTPTKPL